MICLGGSVYKLGHHVFENAILDEIICPGHKTDGVERDICELRSRKNQTTDILHLDPPMRYARLPKRSPVLKKHQGESQLNQTEEPWPSYNVRQHTTQGRSASVAFGH